MKRIKTALTAFIDKRSRLAQVVVVVVLIALAYALLLGRQITSLRTDGILTLQQNRQKQAAERDALQYTQNIVDKYAKANVQDVAKLRALAPSTPDLPAMFVQVEALARAAGLQLNNVNFTGAAAAQPGSAKSASGEAAAGGLLKQMTATFSVSGGSGYASLKNFLATIESSVRLLDVQSISYAPSKEGAAETYQINAVTYSLGQ